MLPFPPSKPIPNLLNHLSNSLLKPLQQIPLTFFEYWLSRKCDHLICTPDDEPFQYRNYYDSYWIPLMLEFGFGKFVIDETKKEPVYDGHRPHDTRHTCISLLTEKEVDERCSIRCRLLKRTEKCFLVSLETCTTGMTSFSRMVIPATAGRKRMSGHVSLNTAKKRAIETPFFMQKCVLHKISKVLHKTPVFVLVTCVLPVSYWNIFVYFEGV